MNCKILLCTAVLLATPSLVAAKTTLKLGVLAFGTVNWEIAALDNEKLLDQADFVIETTRLTSPQAGKIALQSGAVDIIVSDWIWVSRMRGSGADFTFYPYSNTSGALVVSNDSPIKKLSDLNGKRLGIAGGELDKNWLLLQALGLKQQIDLAQSVEQVYGAPPLLNQQLKLKRIDALINYWHFAARLESQGYREILNGEEILRRLGIDQQVPSLGYVFRQGFGDQHKQTIRQFLSLTAKAKNRLCDAQNAWDNIAPLTEAGDAATQKSLRQRYCKGRVKHWGSANQEAAEEVYQLLRKLSHNALTGPYEHIQPGTFWQID